METTRFLITQEGYDRMEKELTLFRTVKRPAVTQAIAEARAHGDLSENAEYDAAKEQQGYIEAMIRDLESKLSRAEVVDVASLSGDTVKFGATFTIMDEETEEKSSYKIVSDYEADMSQKLISLASPLVKALIGKKVGDSIEVQVPKGVKYYEILNIQYI